MQTQEEQIAAIRLEILKLKNTLRHHKRRRRRAEMEMKRIKMTVEEAQQHAAEVIIRWRVGQICEAMDEE